MENVRDASSGRAGEREEEINDVLYFIFLPFFYRRYATFFFSLVDVSDIGVVG